MKNIVGTRHLIRKSIIALAVIAYTIYAFSFSTGIVGKTQKNGSGCTCHGPSPSGAVTVSINGPDTLMPSETAAYTVTISGGPAAAAGTNIAASDGVLAETSATLQKISDELTHTAPVLFEESTVTFQFQYTAPDTEGIQTLYANGNSVDHTGSQFGDEWNFAPNKQVVVMIPIPPSTTTVYDTVRPLWNLVSVPVGVASNRKDSVFPNSISNAFGYNGGYYIEDSLLPGVGYWLKFDSARVVELTGTTIATETVDVAESWNLVGSISTAIPVAALSSDPPGLILSSVYGYDGSYAPANDIVPGKAYWVKTAGSGKIIIAQTSATPKSAYSAIHDLSGANYLTITDRLGHRQTLFFGMIEDIHVPMSYFELPPEPPSGGFDARFASQRLLEVIERNDVREFPLTISTMDYPVTVAWKLSNRAISASLIDNESATLLTPEGSIGIAAPGTELRLKLDAGGSTAENFALHPGYPNPFNPSTSISYELPQRSSVSIGVYDILGKEVRTLLGTELQPGMHSVLWDGNTNDGLASPSGIYFVKMKAIPVDATSHTFSAIRKVVLLR